MSRRAIRYSIFLIPFGTAFCLLFGAGETKGYQNPLPGPMATQEKQDPPELTGWEAVDEKARLAAIDSLIVATEDKDSEVRVAAISLLGRAKLQKAKVLDCLIDLLKDPEQNVVRSASQSLQRLAVKPELKLSRLLLLLENDDPEVVETATSGLSGMVINEKCLEISIDRLADTMIQNRVKEKILLVLKTWGDQVKPASNRLIELFDSETKWKTQILTILRSLETDPKLMVPFLTRAIKDKDAKVRLLAIECLSASWTDGIVPRNISPAILSYVDSFFERYDSDKNGVIDSKEASKSPRGFSHFDQSGDGRVTRDEMLTLLSRSQRNRARSRTSTRSARGR